MTISTGIAAAALAVLAATGSNPAGQVPDPVPAADGTDVWAIGYAVSVVGSCPGWTMTDQEVLHRQGILPLMDLGSPRWRDHGELHQAYWQGFGAAETDRRSHAGFCVGLQTIDPARRRRLLPILSPENPTDPDAR